MLKKVASTSPAKFAELARVQISEGFYPVKGTSYQVSSGGFGMYYSNTSDDDYDFSNIDCIMAGSSYGTALLESYIDSGFVVFDSIQLGGDKILFICRRSIKESNKKSGWALVKYEEVDAPE